jgi:hypothetical protein
MVGTVYDVCVKGDEYIDRRTGKKKIEWRPVGVAFDPKNGGPGVNGKPFNNVGINGDFIIRPRKEKTAAAAPEPESYDDGADFLE